MGTMRRGTTTGGRVPRRGAARRAARTRALAPAPKSPTKSPMKKKQKSITDGPAAALGAARRGAKLVIEPRGAYNATPKLCDSDGECGAANRLRIRPTLLATAPTASSRTAPTTHDSAMPARPQLPTSAGPRRPIPLGWSKLQPPRNPWFRSRTTGRLPGRTRPLAPLSPQMRGVPRGWWLSGSCGFVLQLRHVAPKIDVFLVQIAASADMGTATGSDLGRYLNAHIKSCLRGRWAVT